MSDVKWTKEGKIENLSELTPEEVEAAYDEKNKQIFARVGDEAEKRKKAEELAEQLKKDLEEAKKPPTNAGDKDKVEELEKQVGNLTLSERKRQFGHENGLSPAETDAVFKINPNPTAEDLKDSFIAGGIKAIRDKERQAKNTPGSSNTAPLYNGKKFEDLSPAEKKAHWPEHLAATKKGK